VIIDADKVGKTGLVGHVPLNEGTWVHHLTFLDRPCFVKFSSSENRLQNLRSRMLQA